MEIIERNTDKAAKPGGQFRALKGHSAMFVRWQRHGEGSLSPVGSAVTRNHL